MNSSNASWQKGEVLVVETDLTDTKTKTPIPDPGTNVTIKLTRPNKSTVEPEVKTESEEITVAGEKVTKTTWWAEQPLDEAGEWTGHIITDGDYATKRPFGPITVGDD